MMTLLVGSTMVGINQRPALVPVVRQAYTVPYCDGHCQWLRGPVPSTEGLSQRKIMPNISTLVRACPCPSPRL